MWLGKNIKKYGTLYAPARLILIFGRKKTEGLVHISQLRREGRVKSVEEVVNKGQSVKVRGIKSQWCGSGSSKEENIDQNHQKSYTYFLREDFLSVKKVLDKMF